MDSFTMTWPALGVCLSALVAVFGAAASLIRYTNKQAALNTELLQRVEALERQLNGRPCVAHTERLAHIETQKEAMDRLTDGLLRVLAERPAPQA